MRIESEKEFGGEDIGDQAHVTHVVKQSHHILVQVHHAHGLSVISKWRVGQEVLTRIEVHLSSYMHIALIKGRA